MNLEIRRDRPDQSHQPEVLHDDRVDAGLGHLANSGLELGELVRKDQRVQRHVPTHATPMQQSHHFGQARALEVRGANPRIMALEAEVDRVGAVLDGGDQALAIAGRRQQLGLQSAMTRHSSLFQTSHSRG